ncbi:MAG: hypothetical protein ABIJ16_12565, partial [Bacteroidota bacterium]
GCLAAQNWARDVYVVGKLYPGYIVKTDGEKVEGFIEAQQRGEVEGVSASNQTRVVFYTDQNNKKSKTVYKPDEVKEYLIADKFYKSMNYSGGLMAKPVRFVLRVKEGCISEYMWYNYNGKSGVEYIWDGTSVYQKGDDKPIEQASIALNFAKKMSEYIADDEELSTKVANKEKGYGVTSIYDVVDEYNRRCSK